MTVSERFQGANLLDAGRLSPYWGEHAARYNFALPFIENKAVLDIACGTGYGISILQTKAAYVVGVDADINAAADARHECGKKSYVALGDGNRLPFGDESFDVVTSFETIEHLHDREGFLSELHRVLRERGTLLISTPNANYTMPVNGKPRNPYHVWEYRPAELLAVLEDQFSVGSFMGQAMNGDDRIPPFYDAQKRLPDNPSTRARLLAWKILNKMPVRIRESVSQAVWNKPFYPTVTDYLFSEEILHDAPVLFAVCSKNDRL